MCLWSVITSVVPGEGYRMVGWARGMGTVWDKQVSNLKCLEFGGQEETWLASLWFPASTQGDIHAGWAKEYIWGVLILNIKETSKKQQRIMELPAGLSLDSCLVASAS